MAREPIPMKPVDELEFEYVDEEEWAGACEERCAIIRDKKKTVGSAICFLLVGIVFTALFFLVLLTYGIERAIPYGIVAVLMDLPGGYATWVIVRALCRDPGYSIDILPSYDLD